MLRNIIVAAATAVIVGLGVVFQLTGTTSHGVKNDSPSRTEQTGEAPATDGPAAPEPDGTTTPRAPGAGDSTPTTPVPGPEKEQRENNDRTGKPGEVKG